MNSPKAPMGRGTGRTNRRSSTSVPGSLRLTPPQLQSFGGSNFKGVESRIEPGGGIVVTRIRVWTNGHEGSPYTLKPMMINFTRMREREPLLEEMKTMAVALLLMPLHLFSPRYRTTLWNRPADGFVAKWVPANVYGTMGFGYPEESTLPPYPTPGGGFHFVPLAICDQEIVYIGDIEVRQGCSFIGTIPGVTDMEFDLRDDCEATVALFREPYPELRDFPISRNLLGRMDFDGTQIR